MPGIDYQILNNAYLVHAWNRLSDPIQRILVSNLEQTVRHYATPINLMPRIDYQTLNNRY